MDLSFVGELRSLFKEGATPSWLIRHIVEHHEGQRGLHGLIQAYFFEAFGIPIVRGLNPNDDFRHSDLRYAFLNEHLVHDMIEKRAEWDHGFEGQTGWLDSLEASDDQERFGRLQATDIPELSACWSKLTVKEQSFIQRSMATTNGLYESIKILSRLAECLQQQLLESRKASVADDRG